MWYRSITLSHTAHINTSLCLPQLKSRHISPSAYLLSKCNILAYAENSATITGNKEYHWHHQYRPKARKTSSCKCLRQNVFAPQVGDSVVLLEFNQICAPSNWLTPPWPTAHSVHWMLTLTSPFGVPCKDNASITRQALSNDSVARAVTSWPLKRFSLRCI